MPMDKKEWVQTGPPSELGGSFKDNTLYTHDRSLSATEMV